MLGLEVERVLEQEKVKEPKFIPVTYEFYQVRLDIIQQRNKPVKKLKIVSQDIIEPPPRETTTQQLRSEPAPSRRKKRKSNQQSFSCDDFNNRILKALEIINELEGKINEFLLKLVNDTLTIGERKKLAEEALQEYEKLAQELEKLKNDLNLDSCSQQFRQLFEIIAIGKNKLAAKITILDLIKETGSLRHLKSLVH